MQIVESIIHELSLDNQISTFAGRAELLAIKKSKPFAVLTARALSSLSVLMELASPLLMKHGRIICYKANIEDEELAHAKEFAYLLFVSFYYDS
jgi:16S rRNA (guanine527-N7)-methyltransferase